MCRVNCSCFKGQDPCQACLPFIKLRDSVILDQVPQKHFGHWDSLELTRKGFLKAEVSS